MVFKYTTDTNVYNRSGLSATEINLSTNTNIIDDAENELEVVTGRVFTTGVSYTEYFDGQKQDIIGLGQFSKMVILRNYPIQSITSLQTLNSDQSVNKAYAVLTAANISAGVYYTTDYTLDTNTDNLTNAISATGRINLISDIFPTGTKNIKVVYTAGYATVPRAVQNLATCMAGIRAWISFLGGKYNFLNSYSIPQQSVNKGDLYERGKINIQNLTDEATRLLDQIGRRQSKVFLASGSGSDR